MQTPAPIPSTSLQRLLETLSKEQVHTKKATAFGKKPALLHPLKYCVKIGFDILLSITALLLLLPFLLVLAIITKITSPGNIIYAQERIGRYGKPFTIYKFRSMYPNAEMNGPYLSSATDERITKWGKWMRKYRMDELPQLWNILKGNMSFVGPRPERKFYIDELSRLDPAYEKLQQVKPGLTSCGMVCFGYASNIPEMITRMKYDQLYVQKPSLKLDAYILFYSLKIIFHGKGK